MPGNAGTFLQKSRKRRVHAGGCPVSSEPASWPVLGLPPPGIASSGFLCPRSSAHKRGNAPPVERPFRLRRVHAVGIAFAQGPGLPEAMPANAKTFLLQNGHSQKEEFERAANPPSGIASGGPLRGAKTLRVFIPL
jgi:hypothetical protein